MKAINIISGIVVALWLASATCAAADEGHSFGTWPALSAALEHETQKNLDMGDAGFLLEVWFKPMPLYARQFRGPYALIAKKGAADYQGYELRYFNDKSVELALCDPARNLDQDLRVTAPGIADQNAWHYLAACVDRTSKSVRLYADGKLVVEKQNVELGNLDNSEVFGIGYNPMERDSQAVCRIREARVWKFSAGLPASAEAAIAQHAGNSAEVSAALTGAAGVQYSRWIFSDEGKTIADLGNNGNTLAYSPLAFTPRPVTPAPEGVTGKTIYVDQNSAQASEDGDGTKDRPFKTIQRGLKAARPGDCVHVMPGLYRESVRIPSGDPGKPVTLEGEKDTVMSGAEPLSGWEKQGDKLWIIKGWTGRYLPCQDAVRADARSYPDNLLFVDDRQLDWATGPGDLVPGTWTFRRPAGAVETVDAGPRAGTLLPPPASGTPRDIIMYPPPGVDPTHASVEMIVRPDMIRGGKYARVRGLHLTRTAGIAGAICTSGQGWVVEDNLIDWVTWTAVGAYGQDHIVRRNTMLWCGYSGLIGASTRLLFEDNTIRYAAWRPFNPSWGGGAIKLIPANTDHIMRRNNIGWSNIAGIWYDSANTGNVIENNLVHDIDGGDGKGGIFDEISFGNIIRDNLVYNVNGGGIMLGESNHDQITRNVAFNCSRGAIYLRGSNDARKIDDADKIAQRSREYLDLCSVRRWWGLTDYAADQRLRNGVAINWFGYEPYVGGDGNRHTDRHNTITDNVFINQAAPALTVDMRYVDGRPADPEAQNTWDQNIYWTTGETHVFQSGNRPLEFSAWQKASGQDAHSRVTDPFAASAQLPAWFSQRFNLNPAEFRSFAQTKSKYADGVRTSIALRVLLGRLVQSKTVEAAVFADPSLHGVYFDLDGKTALALWRADMPASSQWLLPSGQITLEDKYMRRQPLAVSDGHASLLIDRDPLTLIGLVGKAAEDNAVKIEVAAWQEPGKNVPVKLTLSNAESQPRDCALNVLPPDGWTAMWQSRPGSEGGRAVPALNSSGETPLPRITLAAGETRVVDIELVPPADLKRGSFQVAVTGRAGTLSVETSKSFAFGSLNVIPRTDLRPRDCTGGLAGWGAVASGAPIGRADTPEQVVYLKKGTKWGGASDCSAKARLMWQQDNNLFIAVEVTDDKLDTHAHRPGPASLLGPDVEGTVEKADATQSDSVEVFLDLRAAWAHYLSEYGQGVCHFVVIPSDADGASAKMQILSPSNLLQVRNKIGCKRTANGYTLELVVHFQQSLEEPWAGRQIRVGMLVNKADASSDTRKLRMGVWRTADDAPTSCTSWTPFVLGN